MAVYILDTETTGLKDPEPIELALLEISYPSLTCFEETLGRFKPSKPIEYGALSTHHILDEDLVGLPSFSDYKLPIQPDDYIIGHNIDYDWRAIGEPDCKRICTKALADLLLPDLDSKSQLALVYYFMRAKAKGLLKEAHSALADVHNLRLVLPYLMEILLERDYRINTVEQLWQVSEAARVPTKIWFGKFRGQPYTALDNGYVNWWLTKSDNPPTYYELIALRRAGFKV